MAETTTVIHLNTRYEIQIERSATKGVDGFKVTAKGDTAEDVERDIAVLLEEALARTKPPDLTVAGPSKVVVERGEHV